MDGTAVKSWHRTNSLGSAKVDCHTCLQEGNCCDRQRPRCGTCVKHHRNCGGFTMNLIWKDPTRSANFRQSPAMSSEHISPATTRSRIIESSKRQFKFVKGPERVKRNAQLPQKRRGRSTAVDGRNMFSSYSEFSILDANNFTPTATSQLEDSSLSNSSHHERASREITAADFGLPSFGLSSEIPNEGSLGDSSVYDVSASALWPDSGFLGPELSFVHTDVESNSRDTSISPEEILQKNMHDFASVINTQQSHNPGDKLIRSHTIDSSHTERFFFQQFPLSAGVQFRDSAHKFDFILVLYDQDFCVLPLTADCFANPFRVQNGCEGAEFLLHAMLAISLQHMSTRDNSLVLQERMHDHASMAISLFTDSLTRATSTRLLDALLILVNFQATQSAFGKWNLHLMGARKILEGLGILEKYNTSPRIRAQVAILVWWDVTIALISRREPLLPEEYLQMLLEHDRNRRDGWTFFVLNGCPAYFAVAMRRLARLASIYEKVSSLEWATFDTTPVQAVVKEITLWKNDDDINTDEAGHTEVDEDDMEERRNRFHCKEAWRYAILLYVRRVFVQKQDASGLRSITYLAREILDHIRCIPRTAIVQKQVLLPVFLAGAEAGDEAARDFVREYCSYWSVRSGHFMFSTVRTLFESIWTEWHVSNRDVYWWGVKVDNTAVSSSSGERALVSELLLG